ncbi:MAG: hypothetical protein H6695_07390 [Deferribacteres bacterium]|nr:hypothetical protein [candidate division KSB1 bacterium]MCB9509987.1 hypothetical protein [Deferribacteres bacterium]
MKKLIDMVVPHIGLQFDWTPVTHFIRDLLFTYILYQVGYREAHAAFATMLIAGFWEAGNGVCYNQDGGHCHFDVLDFLPSVFAGFLMLGFLTSNFNTGIVLTLATVYLVTIVVFLALNLALGRKIIFKY